MKGFVGFPAGGMRFTPVPDLFFSAILPQIDNLAELKVTLHFLWALNRKKGFPRCLTLQELLADGTLLSGLKLSGRAPAENLREGLLLAIARQTVLHLAVEIAGESQELYFLNTAKGRSVVESLRRGELDIGQIVRLPAEPANMVVERPNAFALYEQNVGLLTPMIAEELREAEKLYPAEWLEEAFKLAAELNKRNWRYIRRILERWAVEGKSDEKDWRSSKRTYTSPKYYRKKS
ncbi:MAG: DnaD domain protein [Chloroflexi bacterium]|nr:DnaD domain protein [Chloroflexota bacterium]